MHQCGAGDRISHLHGLLDEKPGALRNAHNPDDRDRSGSRCVPDACVAAIDHQKKVACFKDRNAFQGNPFPGKGHRSKKVEKLYALK